MGKTKKGTKPPGYDYSDKRTGYGWLEPSKKSKDLTHKRERKQGKRESEKSDE